MSLIVDSTLILLSCITLRTLWLFVKLSLSLKSFFKRSFFSFSPCLPSPLKDDSLPSALIQGDIFMVGIVDGRLFLGDQSLYRFCIVVLLTMLPNRTRSLFTVVLGSSSMMLGDCHRKSFFHPDFFAHRSLKLQRRGSPSFPNSFGYL